VRAVFGDAALVQRCQVHKLRNVLDHVPERQRPWARAIIRRAYQSPDLTTALRLLQDLARRLETDAPSAAESVREGLEETLTILSLGLSARLRRSLATTNAIESLIGQTRQVKRHVKRWRSRQMMLRWVAAGIREAASPLPSPLWPRRFEDAGGGAAAPRSAARAQHHRTTGRVECHRVAAQFQHRTGTTPNLPTVSQ
jgi:transposase-like protein